MVTAFDPLPWLPGARWLRADQPHVYYQNKPHESLHLYLHFNLQNLHRSAIFSVSAARLKLYIPSKAIQAQSQVPSSW